MSQAVRVLIVEDEFLTADIIKDGLEEIGYRISGIVKDATEALSILNKNTTDIAILDINIQGKRDGIWIGNEISKEFKIPFIFLTAYSDKETIQNALKTKPYSFLVKPFNKTDVYTAIELGLTNFAQTKVAHSIKETRKKDAPLLIDEYLFVKEKQLYSKIAIKDILFVQSDLKYVQIHVKEKSFLLRYNLSEMLEILPVENFIQVHRSYIVNKDRIEQIGANFLFIDKIKIPLSNSKKENLNKLLRFL